LASLRYRPDIDGLRAVAIISVLVFHAWPSLLKCGFIGVDIFFVISGFLISRIIFQRFESVGFSYRDFYVSRIKRIFPSLIIVLSASTVLGWFVLFTVEYRQLGLQLAAASTFTSNLVLWFDTGYFDSAANLKPLLHLWSLGVEEQFYIVWPAVAILALKHGRFLSVIAVSGLLSFVASALLSYSSYSSFAFYMPFTRFWELATGGLLAFVTLHAAPIRSTIAHWLSFAGLSSYVLGLAITTTDTVFPGFVVVLPVLGSALLILAGPRAFINRRLLSHSLMVRVGLISYPLYLWHWPLLVYFRTLQGGPLSPLKSGVAVLLAFILAVLSYELLEKRIRGIKSRGPAVAASLCVAMAAVGMAGSVVHLEGGVAARAINELNPSDRAVGIVGGDLKRCAAAAPEIRSLPYCVIQRDGAPRYAMLGDSKAAALFPGVVEEAGTHGHWMLVGGHGARGSPLPVISSAPQYAHVQPMAVAATDLIARTPSIEIVVLVMATRELFVTDDRFLKTLADSENYEIAFDGLDRTIDKFVNAGKKVVIVVDNPALEESAICLPRNTESPFVNRLFAHQPNEHCSISLAQNASDTLPYQRLLQRLRAKWGNNLAIFSPLDSLCDGGTGTCASFKGGHALYSYSDHLSDYGARLEGAQLLSFIGAITGRGDSRSGS
jgi:peptidoglycan/LPS O-acetylase OafA/YrhL